MNLSFRRTWPLFLDTTASLGTFPLIAHSMVGYGRLKETIRVREREIKDANSFKMQRFYHAFVGLTR